MANVKICGKCSKIGLDQYNFRVQYDSRRNKYYYQTWCIKCENKYIKQYRKDNEERIKKTHKKYYQNNKEFRKEYNKQWLKNNSDKNRQNSNKHWALKAGAEGSHTIEDLKYIYNHQQGKCPCCKKYIPFENITVDHIVPLTWGGSNYASNIQLLCLSCNSAKRNYHDTDYRNYIPLFLK